ncbi:hypothetical protein [Nitrosomonas marina]|uniref:Uncharacterized protein n=1 Tax=Nitrosomonas marina TaxID=917 RepID=A0A1H8ARA5_9PROT|nr:hypothetical protein [Nitrosomonas marina]SEM72339.1 hypothetical protein SAMN05216325_101255 [Nitrosomonas marina]
MLEWWQVKTRSNYSIARVFRFPTEALAGTVNSLDMMTHSLGGRVGLKALKECSGQRVIRNYYCTAAAVDNENLEPGEEFFESAQS